ncbi:MAG TPA: class A beta-lactamase, subclass A2 [Pyrinomonadaceae bacterium]|nr:class A beta-lactamase, subclass A2 [Pyrinomonadaceae bacterium]
MKRILPALILASVSFIIACSGSDAATRNAKSNTSASNSSDAAKTVEKEDAELQKQLEQIAAAAKGRVGVRAVLLETGQSVSLNSKERFPMQSVYKLPIGMAVLEQVDAGRLKLDQRVRVEKSDYLKKGQHSPIRDRNPEGAELSLEELLRFAVSESDGVASDVALRIAGGSEAVMKYLAGLNVTDIIVADSEKKIGQDWETQYRNWASPEGAVALLRALQERRTLSAKSYALLLKFMTDSPTGPKRLKGLLPKDAVVAHKTGTSSANSSGVYAATNDIGIITLPGGRHVAIAVFVSDSPADEATREGVIAKIAKAVWDKWGN